MRRIHALVLALAVGVAAVAGGFAALRTTAAAAPQVSAAEVARQNRLLDRAEAALAKEARRTPPALAPAPDSVGRTGGSGAPQTVIYRRAPTIVRVVHRRHSEREPDGGELDD
jgi:hypothetical protein